MTTIFKNVKKKKERKPLDVFKVTRVAGFFAVATTFAFHQFVALPEHMNIARVMSLGASLMLLFYEFVIYRREMRRRKEELEAKDKQLLRENVRSFVSDELRNNRP